MHFYYIDEAGCTGEDLQNDQQPIFVAGGIVVRDEGWNRTKERFSELIASYFDNDVPNGFELHSHHLLSPNGESWFEGHERNRRMALAHGLLDLIVDRSHQTAYFAIDKQKLHSRLTVELRSKTYLPRRAPYTIAYDYLVSEFEWYTKERLGRSARAMVIGDTKTEYETDIAVITHFRRVVAPTAQRVKWLTEFTYAIDSHRNPMVQLSDLVCFVTKKFLEIEAGYRDTWSLAAKVAYRDLYSKIHDRLIRKDVLSETGRYADQYNEFIEQVGVWPSRQFRNRTYE